VLDVKGENRVHSGRDHSGRRRTFLNQPARLGQQQTKPRINCRLDGQGVRVRKEVNLAFAVDLGEGLLAPVIRDADKKSLGELAKAARDLAERILATLPPKDRLVITLREVQGFEIAEIATALGCSRPAAKVRLFRARRAMQAALGRLIREEEQKARPGRREEDDLP